MCGGGGAHAGVYTACVVGFKVVWLQINKHYHAVKGGAYSSEHIDQGVTFLIQLVKTMRRRRPNWSKEQQLKGRSLLAAPGR